MAKHDFYIEELEERIAPSSLNFAVAQPTSDSSATTSAQTMEPSHWHPLWPVDPWPPVQ